MTNLSLFAAEIPLSLYIHFPWCVKKCPYCDFNSHSLKDNLPETLYIEKLLANLHQQLPLIQGRSIRTIFMGGGTPSLFSPESIALLLSRIQEHCSFVPDIEITLEANPATVMQARFEGYLAAGINRLSIGVQSFDDQQLQKLGRIHDAKVAHQAISAAQRAGFTNINIDLMFGLAEQSLAQGLDDLSQAIAHGPQHISWYELTIEPNTYFAYHPPILPSDERILELQTQGQALLAQNGFAQYEISAYSRAQPCQHNLNYWRFGDYAAIGAGSHAKITDPIAQTITRIQHLAHPKTYLAADKNFIYKQHLVSVAERPFEFMLNALRLKKGVATPLFSAHTGLALTSIQHQLSKAQQKGWMTDAHTQLCTTPLGFLFLNDVQSLFLND